jgi:hypothetical protein
MVAKGEIGRAVELSVPIGARHFGRSPERPKPRGGQSGNGGRRHADLDGFLSSACGHRMRVFLQSRSFR